MANKLTNAAGTAKTVGAATAILDTPSPRVVLGSFTLNRRTGNEGRVDYFGRDFSLNVRGIPSPAVEEWVDLVEEVAKCAHSVNKTVCVSVAAFEPSEYGKLTRWAFDAGADAVELNFGCPNMQDGRTFAPIFSYRPEMVSDACASLDCSSEIWAKVSPIFDDSLFADIASVLRRPTIKGVVAVNTLPQCLALDVNGKPVLSFGSGVGGMAGPAIKPIALAQVRKWVREGFRTIGVGGITRGRDLQDFLACGAESCQVNSVMQCEGPQAINRILQETY